MAYVSIPKDLSRVKSKFLFNLTKRQVVCFGLGGADGRSHLLSGEGCAGCQPFGAAHDAAYAAVLFAGDV